jgi:GNAT superfamily N-acetyltransferase
MTEPMPLRIREASPDDAVKVAALLDELGYPENDVADVRERLTVWSREPAGIALVAEDDGCVVGVVAVTAIPYLEHEGRWGRVVALVVSAERRGRGIGRQLIEAAEQAAIGYGCVSMEVTSARRRTESHAFYRRLGYVDWCDRSARYQKDLVPGALSVSNGGRT